MSEEKQYVNEELLSEATERGGIKITMLTKEQLIDLCNGIGQDLENCRKVRDSHYDRIIEMNKNIQDLRVSLAQWRYAAMKMFNASTKAQKWIQAVQVNISHYAGFTHHMRSIVDLLNQNELESAEQELSTPTEEIRQLMKENSINSDIPF